MLFSEMAKCVISLTMLSRMLVRGEGKAVGELNLKTALLFSIPGLLYFINNNIPFYCLMYLEPPSYQVCSHVPHPPAHARCRLAARLTATRLTPCWVDAGELCRCWRSSRLAPLRSRSVC